MISNSWGSRLGAAGKDPLWGPFMLLYSLPPPDPVCTCHGEDRILAQGPELGKGVSLVRFCLQTARSRSETPGGGQSITEALSSISGEGSL